MSSQSSSTTSTFEQCSLDASSDTDLVQCIANALEQQNKNSSLGLDIFFVLYAGSLMFFMQAGFAMLCAGCVRQKNVQNTMLKNLLDACGAAIGFWSVGYGFAYGGGSVDGPATFIGTDNFFMMGVEAYEKWVFQFAFAATAATIVAGTLAERCQMVAYMCYSVMLTGFVYPVTAHSIWSQNGFLSLKYRDPFLGSGMVDFAGSGVVHVTGGMTALIATRILGPRKDRFHDVHGNPLVNPQKLKGHSPSLQVLGTFILWFGWFGFNAGSTASISQDNRGRIAALAAVVTALGASAGCLSSLLFTIFLSERRTGEKTYDLTCALNGSLSGLVSVTAGCALIDPWAGVLVGAIAGIIYVFSSELLVKYRIDDAVDAIPVHLFNGIWGVIAVSLFAKPSHLQSVYGREDHAGLFYGGDAIMLAANLVGLLFICSWVFVIMTPFFLLLSYVGYFRSDPLEEIVGLDISYHGAEIVQPNSDLGSQNNVNHAIKPEILELLERRKRASTDNVVA